MDLITYRAFTIQLRQRLEADNRVLGLVALGSMAEIRRLPDAWSDHDFFVITQPSDQETLRQDLSWLPNASTIVLSIRETAHGLKVIYANGHVLEFAIFDLTELQMAKVNDYHVVFERVPLTEQLMRITQVNPSPASYEPQRDCAMVMALLLIGTGRFARGEQLSAHLFVKHHALHHLLPLLRHLLQPRPEALVDNLDGFRRFEQSFPEVGAAINQALLLPIPLASLALLDILDQWVQPRLTDYPIIAGQVIRQSLNTIAESLDGSSAPRS